MEPVDPPVKRALVMICEKCGRKLAPSAEVNLSREVQQFLKSETKALWGKGEVRTVVTSCLDICPEDKIAVGINFLGSGPQRTEFFVAEPGDVAEMAESILDLIKKK